MAKSTKIHEQEQALSVYLKDMLGEQEPIPKPVKETEVIEPVAPVIAPPAPTETVTTKTPVAEQTATPSEAASEANDLEGEIRLLLFKAAGMELAIPVSELNNIVRWPDKPLTKIPGKAAWALGIYTNMGIHTEVIDVQPVLVPKQNDSTNSNSFGYIILVEDNQWGIASEQIREIVSIPKNEVNWRSAENAKRPWFKGIVNSKMSSILDINALINALQSK